MFTWLKAFHLIFIVCWFAGIFYAPRIFVYLSQAKHQETYSQLFIMAKRLLYFVTPFLVLTLGLGLFLTAQNVKLYFAQGWFHIKLFCVLLLVIYHLSCFYFLHLFKHRKNSFSSKFYRIYNELPVILLFSIIILVVIKPNF